MNKRIWNVIKQNESEPTNTDLRLANKADNFFVSYCFFVNLQLLIISMGYIR